MQVESAPKLLLNLRDAAQSLSISDRTLWGLTAPRGPIPSVRVGQSVRYSVDSLREYIAKNTERGAE